MHTERDVAANQAATRIQSWVKRYLALNNWPKLRSSLQQARQQRGMGQTQQHRGLDHSAYDVCEAALELKVNQTLLAAMHSSL